MFWIGKRRLNSGDGLLVCIYFWMIFLGIFMKAVATFVLSMAFTGAVSAAEGSATLASAQGSVMVNQGKQFVPVQSGQVLAAGDRVMVMQGGSAVLRSSDGCEITLSSGSITEVPKVSTCAGGKLNSTRLANEAPPWINPEAPAAYGTSTWMLVGAGALVVGGLVAGGSDNNDSISP
jgi:hypothetical protein